MSLRDTAAWTLCGAGWHVLVALLVWGSRAPFWWGVPAGVVAGVAAGAMTLRSRRKRGGREHWGDLLLTYVAAVLVYAVGLWCTQVVCDVWLRGAKHDAVDLLLTYVFYGLVMAGLWAVALVPLCYVTRWLVWWLHTRWRVAGGEVPRG